MPARYAGESPQTGRRKNDMKEKIEKDQLKQISGGCGVVNRIIGDPQCDCSGEYVDMVKIGSDSTGRITYWQCPLCGKEESVYG